MNNYFDDFQFLASGRQPTKGTQTDGEASATPSGSTKCNCDAKYNKIFNDFKARLEINHKDEKDRALRDLESRVSTQVCTLKQCW